MYEKKYFDAKPIHIENFVNGDMNALYTIEAKCDKLTNGDVTGFIVVEKKDPNSSMVYWRVTSTRFFHDFMIVDSHTAINYRRIINERLRHKLKKYKTDSETSESDMGIVDGLCAKLDEEIRKRYDASLN